MKLPSISLYFFLLCVSAGAQINSSPIRTERNTPSTAKDAAYFDEPMQLRKRIDKTLLKMFSPSAVEKEKYKTFLAQPKTGIVRLFKKKDCPEKSPRRIEDMMDYAKKCPTGYIQGGGKNFSFRQKKHVDDNQSDLTFKDGVLFSNGLLNQSILVGLGDIPIENVSPETPGLEYLANHIPATDIDEIDAQNQKISKGIESNGFLYGKGFKLDENATYAMRVVAYNVDLKTRSNYLGLTITFDPFHEDVREDVLVVFKVFNEDDDGATLVWRELQRKKSPELKAKK